MTSIKEAIEKLEKALEVFSWCQENADEKWMVDHLAAVRIDIDQALAKLRTAPEQPPEGDFIKKLRNFVKLYENEIPRRAEITFLKEACEEIKNLKAAFRRYGHHDSPCAGILDLNEDAECVCGFEDARKKDREK